MGVSVLVQLLNGGWRRLGSSYYFFGLEAPMDLYDPQEGCCPYDENLGPWRFPLWQEELLSSTDAARLPLYLTLPKRRRMEAYGQGRWGRRFQLNWRVCPHLAGPAVEFDGTPSVTAAEGPRARMGVGSLYSGGSVKGRGAAASGAWTWLFRLPGARRGAWESSRTPGGT